MTSEKADPEVTMQFCVWKLDKNAESVIKRASKYAKEHLEKLFNKPISYKEEIAIISAYGDIETTLPSIAFGELAFKNTNHINQRVWKLPDPKFLTNGAKNLNENTKKAAKIIESACRIVFNDLQTKQGPQSLEKVRVYLITKEGISAGKTDTFLEISEEEAGYLRTLKELLDGSEIVIEKGDTKVRIR